MGSVPSPQTPRQLPLHKSLTFERPAPGPGSKESLDGDGEPGAAGTDTRLGSRLPPSPAHPPVTAWLLRAAVRPGVAGTRPAAARSQERRPGVSSLQEEPVGRKPGVEGFGLHTCNSWMSQK